MGIFSRLANVFKPSEPDTCASSYPNWKPSSTWKPEFDDSGATPEAYDGN